MRLSIVSLAPMIPLSLLPCSLASAQNPTIVVAKTNTANALTTALGVQATASNAPGLPFMRLPNHPSVVLQDVSVAGQYQVQYTVDVTNSNATPASGSFASTVNWWCTQGLNWGPSDGYNTGWENAFTVPASQSATPVHVWSENPNGHYTPSSPQWPFVLNSCVGSGLIDFKSTSIGAMPSVNVPPGAVLNSLQVHATSTLSLTMSATLLAASNVTSYCTALAGATGVPSTLEAYGAPVSGQPAFVIRIKDVPPASPTMLVVATGQANQPFGTFFACLSGARLYSSPIVVPGISGTHDFNVNLREAMPGTTVYAQAFLREGGLGTTLSTQGLAIAVLP